MSLKIKLLFSLAILAVAIATPLAAQIGGGSIVGTVKDPTGAPVPDVQITVHSQETNEERTATTNSDGYYEFPLLPSSPATQSATRKASS